MAQDSKRKRRLRRLKRENSLLFRQTQIQLGQMQQLANLVMKSQQDWKDLKATLEQAEEQQEMQPTPELTVEQQGDALTEALLGQFPTPALTINVVEDETEEMLRGQGDPDAEARASENV